MNNIDYKTFLETSNYSQRTIHEYMSMKRWLSDAPKQIDINDFLALHSYPLARSFLNNYVKGYLNNQELIITKIKGRIRQSVKDKFLTDEEYETLMKSLATREEVICRLMREGAFRINEIIAKLKPENINWSNLEIKLYGKGNKEKIGIITTSTMLKLKNYIDINKIEPQELVFGCHYTTIWIPLKKISIKVLNKRVSPHFMKRTCGRWMEDMGYPLEERQFYLGHSKPETTQQCYSFKKGKDIIDKIRIKFKDD
jgi:integrase